jgi:hypothetical protein
MTRKFLAATLVAAVASAGCSPDALLSSVTKPSTTSSQTGVQALSGTWASVAPATGVANTCTSFNWNVTNIDGDTGSGSFTAQCFNNMTINGTASGKLSGDTITWTSTAVGTSPSIDNCPISLAGTATLTNDQIRVPFTGTTCLGAVSGTEILRK